jgi:hypothetical protein
MCHIKAVEVARTYIVMETKQIEVYSEASNNAIVRMPTRRFPGVVLQGDSLAILFAGAMDLLERLDPTREEELFYTALSLAEDLEARLKHYEAVISEHGFQLPYLRDPARSAARFALP